MANIGTDAFAGTSGDALSTYDADWVASSGTTGDGTISDAGRVCGATTATVVRYRSDLTPPSADYSVACDLYIASTATNRVGVCARQSASANTRYQTRYNRLTNGVELAKVVAGTTTQLGSTSSQTANAGSTYRLELRLSGTTIEAYWDGAGSPTITQTDSAITAAGHPGIFFLNPVIAGNSIGVHIDNWTADTLGGGPLSASITEAAATADLQSASAVLNATLTEATAGADLQSAMAALIASLVDPAAGTDTQASGSVVSATQVEGVDVAELQSAAATLAAQITEGVAAADLLAASMIVSVVATEAAAGVDIGSTATTYTGTAVEAVVTADALSAAATLIVQVLEAGGAQEQLAAAQSLVALLTEAAAGSDVASGAMAGSYSVTAVELAGAVEVLTAAIGEAVLLIPSRHRGVDYLVHRGMDYPVLGRGVDCHPC